MTIVWIIIVVIANWQWGTWSRRSRRSEVLVDDRRHLDPDYREPPGGYRR